VQLHENCAPGKGVFTEGAIGDFFGYRAAAAERPPGKLSERESASFSRQLSEDVRGRKKIPRPGEDHFPDSGG
jgi:hypothetical protein